MSGHWPDHGHSAPKATTGGGSWYSWVEAVTQDVSKTAVAILFLGLGIWITPFV